MAAAGLTQEGIARLLKISLPTLRQHFGYELATAMDAKNNKVARSLYDQAIGGNVSAQIFWLKCRARWKEHGEAEVVAPMPTLDWSKLSLQEVETLQKLVQKAQPKVLDIRSEE